MGMTLTNRKRKSEKLTPKERESFKNWVSDQPTKIDAADSLGVVVGTLDRLLFTGSASPETIGKVRLKISQNNAA